MTDDPLVRVYVPSLAHVLLAREDELGRELTEEEVEEARAKAHVEMVPLSEAIRRQRERGFRDLDTDDAYQDYLAVRTHLRRYRTES